MSVVRHTPTGIVLAAGFTAAGGRSALAVFLPLALAVALATFLVSRRAYHRLHAVGRHRPRPGAGGRGGAQR